jgi:hypothetical protein
MLRYCLFLFLFINQNLWAEYRVFELEITTYAPVDPTAPVVEGKPPEELSKRTLLSTLDPEQYRGYHTVEANQQIRYISTWRCPGRTANKDYCPNPKVKTDDQAATAPSENQ